MPFVDAPSPPVRAAKPVSPTPDRVSRLRKAVPPIVNNAKAVPRRGRNDPAQYDDLADQWWDGRGRFAMLQWIARARSELIPPAPRPDAVLVDVACGAGLVAPSVRRLGYRHVGVDLIPSAAAQAQQRGVAAVVGDARRLPLPDTCADVVVAGECLEHIPPLAAVVAEACRLLRPGGTLIIDTLAATRTARFCAITVAERLPGGPPPRLHDPQLFIDRTELVAECRRHGVELKLHGLRPSVVAYVAWLARLRPRARMVRTRYTGVLFAAVGTKSADREGPHEHDDHTSTHDEPIRPLARRGRRSLGA